MADNKNAETFALGLIIAAIIYLLFRREFEKLSGHGGCSCSGGGGSAAPGAPSRGGGGDTTICGKCADGCAMGAASSTPGKTGVIPLGGSLTTTSYENPAAGGYNPGAVPYLHSSGQVTAYQPWTG